MKKIKKNILFSTLGVIGVILLCSPLFFLNNKNKETKNETNLPPTLFFNTTSAGSIDSYEKIKVVPQESDYYQQAYQIQDSFYWFSFGALLPERKIESMYREGHTISTNYDPDTHTDTASDWYYAHDKVYKYFAIKKNNINFLDNFFLNINTNNIAYGASNEEFEFEYDGRPLEVSPFIGRGDVYNQDENKMVSEYELEHTDIEGGYRTDMTDLHIFPFDGFRIFKWNEDDIGLSEKQVKNKYAGDYFICEIYIDLEVEWNYYHDALTPGSTTVTRTINEIKGSILPYIFSI